MAQLAARPALSIGERIKDSLFYFPLVLGGLIILTLVFVVLFGPLLAPHNPYLIDRLVVPHYDFESETYIRVPVLPGPEYPLGTDERGMDIVSLLLYGARTTVIAGVLIASTRVVIGLAAGMVMGWNENKWIDRFLLGVMNVITSIPALVAGMILIYSLGIQGGMGTFWLALTLVGWTEVAQYMRSEVLVLRKMPYMEGARVVGASETEMLLRHVFPNILPQLFVLSFLEIGSVLMLIGELALVGVFIGGGSTLDLSDLMAPPTIVGIPTHPEWGASVASGFRWFRSFPHVVMMPALAIFLSVLGFNAFGEGMRAFFEKRGVKATFLLGKRLLYVAGAVALVIYLVLNSTRPSLWFKEMAEGFQSTRMSADSAGLAAVWSTQRDAEGVYPAARWLADEFNEYEFNGGIRWSNPIYLRTADLYEGETPSLSVGGAVFDGENEVAFIVDDYGGSGVANGPLLAMSFPFFTDRTLFTQVEAVPMEGRVLLLEEGNMPVDIPQYFVTDRGAAGIIWIAPEGEPVESYAMFVHPTRDLPEPRRVPAIRVSYEVGQQLLAQAGLNTDFFEPGEMFVARELETSAEISVNLGGMRTVDLNSVVTFRPGTDADLGDEILLVYALCDGFVDGADNVTETPDPACTEEYMLELARLFNENLIDIRRPIMFVVWGGGEYGTREFVRWLMTDDSYSITAPGMRLSPFVTTAIQLVGDSSGTSELGYISNSEDLTDILENSASETGQSLVELSQSIEPRVYFPNVNLPYQLLLQVDTSGNEAIQKKQGETLAFMMIRLVREDLLPGD